MLHISQSAPSYDHSAQRLVACADRFASATFGRLFDNLMVSPRCAYLDNPQQWRFFVAVAVAGAALSGARGLDEAAERSVRGALLQHLSNWDGRAPAALQSYLSFVRKFAADRPEFDPPDATGFWILFNLSGSLVGRSIREAQAMQLFGRRIHREFSTWWQG